MGTSKNRFEKGKWVEFTECKENLLVRLYALRGGLKKQSVCYTHFHSNKVFRGDLIIKVVICAEKEMRACSIQTETIPVKSVSAN
jgi:hypothetical protein